MEQDKDLNKELKDINKRIGSISASIPGKKWRYGNYLLLLVLVVVCLFALFYFGIGFTGFATFSESVIKTEKSGFSIDSSGTIKMKTDLDNINSMMLSGTVYGNGKAAVFLVKPERKYLAYYFEGDASTGVPFSDMCYDTCHIEGLGKENTLLFELENTRINIEKIKYIYSRIIDFDLEPRTFSIDYEKTPSKIINLKLTNKELTDYAVLLYIDGPLSSSFSWQGSLVHMTPEEPEKIIRITVKLPGNLQKGTYTHKITARYVPPDTFDFVGESPVAESFITVYNE